MKEARNIRKIDDFSFKADKSSYTIPKISLSRTRNNTVLDNLPGSSTRRVLKESSFPEPRPKMKEKAFTRNVSFNKYELEYAVAELNKSTSKKEKSKEVNISLNAENLKLEVVRMQVDD
jgi:hypothetical protein